MVLLLSWMAICAHYLGDYSGIKDTWWEELGVIVSIASAMAYAVNVFVPPVKIINRDNELLSVLRFFTWLLWGWKLLRIFSGYVFVAIFLIPILFWIFWSCYADGYVNRFECWQTLQTDPDLGQWALAAFCLWWMMLCLRLVKLNETSKAPSSTSITGPMKMVVLLWLSIFSLISYWGVPPELVLKHAKEKIEKQDWDGAIVDYTQVIKYFPRKSEVYIARGHALELKGNYIGAIADYTTAMKLHTDPNPIYFSMAYAIRGRALLGNSDWAGAIADIDMAVSLNSNDSQAYTIRAIAKRNRGDFDGAIEDFNKAISLDSTQSLYYAERGYTKLYKGEFEDALIDVNSALQLDSKNAIAYFDRAYIQWVSGKSEEAVSDFISCLDLSPPARMVEKAHLFLWLIRMQREEMTRAQDDLAVSIGNHLPTKNDDHEIATARFLLNQITEGDYLKTPAPPSAMNDQRQRCVAWYFIGMKRKLANDASAQDCFRKCIETHDEGAFTYFLAKKELENRR